MYDTKLNNTHQLANSLRTSGMISGRLGQLAKAISYFLQAIQARVKTGNLQNVADDWIDFGNYFLNVLDNYSKAENCYLTALDYANRAGSFGTIAKIEANIGAFYFYQGMYKQALQH